METHAAATDITACDRLAFTFDDYARLLDAVLAGGYRFTSFVEDDGRPGVVLLRHDIDKDVGRARRIAEMEHRLGVRSTYFFLLRCPLYSLLEPESLEHARAIAAMGHWIGLHCDERRMMRAQNVTAENLDEGVVRELATLEAVLGVPVERAVSFHNPTPLVVGRAPATDGYVSAYDPRFMMPATKYLSDSNAFWREGDPLPVLREARWPRLQILIHPFWWASERAERVTDVLGGLLEKRRREVGDYLVWSNDVWRAFCEREGGARR